MTREELSIFQKFESNFNKLKDFCSGYIGRGRSKGKQVVNGKDIKKFGFKEMDVPKQGNQIFIQNIYSAESGVIGSFAVDFLASETVTIITDGDIAT